MEICYLDINGPTNNGNTFDPSLLKKYPPFDPKLGLLAPAIVEYVCEFSDMLNLNIEILKDMFISIAQTNQTNLKLPISPIAAWQKLHKELKEYSSPNNEQTN